MKLLLVIGVVLVLWTFFRDRRSPSQRLADADADDDLAYLEEHLPQITADEAERLGWRLGEKNPGIASGSPEWGALWEKAVLEERRQKYRASLRKVTR